MAYTTSNGVSLRIGRIDRNVIDALALAFPMPVPPTKTVKVWGGTQEIDDEDDPRYVNDLVIRNLGIAQQQLEIMTPAIEILDDWANDERYQELIDAGIVKKDDVVDYLKFVALTDQDTDYIINEILYNSTVTERGIKEASTLYGVTWHGVDIEAFRIQTTAGKFSRLFEDRNAAAGAFTSWSDFCKLSGYEQSAIVAHYRLRTRLECLISQEQSKAKK